MPNTPSDNTLAQFTTFGDLLKFLRRRAGLTQRELSIAVGYSHAQISRLESNQRLPDIPTLTARFAPELLLDDQPAAVSRLLELAAAVRREDAPAHGLPPFRGLLYFDENDTELFFGREALTARLTERLMALLAGPPGPRFLAVVGASGSGKSSLVRAGLIPAVRWQPLAAGWRVHVLTPTAHPLEALAASLLGEAGVALVQASLVDVMLLNPAGLHLTLQRQAQRAGFQQALFFVDQFEELFALCRAEPERRAFVDNLMYAAGCSPDGPPAGLATLVIALRADFYAQSADYPALRAALAHSQEFIGGMDAAELRRAIEAPAQHDNWELEPGLVDALLRDVGADANHLPEPGALPLLSHALLETWQRRRGRSLTLSGYAASGGVRGAIAETAETVFHDQLNPEQRAIARQIFVRLTELGANETIPDTRRRVTLDELIVQPERAAVVRDVITLLADARLVTTETGSAEVAHEALIREWPTLREWLAEDREGLRLQRRLTEAAHDWQRAGRDDGALYRGARLAQAHEWAETHPNELNALEREFLAASGARAGREADEREAQRQNELDAARKLAASERQRAEGEAEHARQQSRTATQLRRRALYLSAAFVLAVVMAGAALFFGEQARQNANAMQRESRLSFSRELVAASVSNLATDPQRSLLLALEAVTVTQELGLPLAPETEAALHQALWAVSAGQEWLTVPITQSLAQVAFSPDGTRLASASPGNSARMWDAATGQALAFFQERTASVEALAFGPECASPPAGCVTLLATAGNDNTARLWDAATGRLLLPLSSFAAVVNDVAFSPNGTVLATSSENSTIRLWSLTTAPDGSLTASPLPIPARQDFPVGPLAFSPDGLRLAAGLFGTSITVWDAATGALRVSLEGHSNWVLDVAFSPDGQLIASGSRDGTARLWDGATGQAVHTLVGFNNSVNGVAFSQDGSRLFTASRDGSLKIWDVATGQELLALPTSGANLYGLALSPDGSRLATAGDDALRVYALRTDDLIALAHAHVTRRLTADECRRFLHQPQSECGPVLPAATLPSPAVAATGRICEIGPQGPRDGLLVGIVDQGVHAAAARFSWETALQYPESDGDIPWQLKQFIRLDCNLIVSLFGYDSLAPLAREHPDQNFWSADQPNQPPLANVWMQLYTTDQAAFQAGYLAAALTKTGKVGTFGSVDAPAVTDFMDGFALGVAYYNQQHGTDVQVLGWDAGQHSGRFVGNVCCLQEGQTFARGLLEEGADILMPAAGPVLGAGALAAVRAQPGALYIGVDYDWSLAIPADADIIITSVEKRHNLSVVRAVEAIVNGDFTGGQRVGTLATGDVGLSPFHEFEAAISSQLRAELNQIAVDIASGAIQTRP